MTLQEYNKTLDELLDRGDMERALALQDEYPELTKLSIDAYSWRAADIDANDQLQQFRQLVYKRAGKHGIKKLEQYIREKK